MRHIIRKLDDLMLRDMGCMEEEVLHEGDAQYNKLTAQYATDVESISVEVPTGIGSDRVGVRVAMLSVGVGRWLLEVYNPNRGMAGFSANNDLQGKQVAAAVAKAFKDATAQMRNAHEKFRAEVKKLQ